MVPLRLPATSTPAEIHRDQSVEHCCDDVLCHAQVEDVHPVEHDGIHPYSFDLKEGADLIKALAVGRIEELWLCWRLHRPKFVNVSAVLVFDETISDGQGELGITQPEHS